MIPKEQISLLLCFVVFILDQFGFSDADTSAVQKFSLNIEYFGYGLLAELQRAYPKKDIIFSPFSVETILAMTRMGAEDVTAHEMDKVLFGYSQDVYQLGNAFHSVLEDYRKSGFIKVANKIYVMQGYDLKDKFNLLLNEMFFSSAQSIDFAQSKAAADTINSWVMKETNEKIKNVVSSSSLDKDSRLVLVNAIYFNGIWLKPFNERFTASGKFKLEDGTTTDVQTMFAVETYNYVYLQYLKAAALELPYSDNDLSLIIILPNNGTDIALLERWIRSTSLRPIVEKMKPEEVRLYLPKFTAELDANLNVPLSNMGMKRMFTEQAEFGNMLKSNQSLHISSVVHKAFIEVNEKGTEAAAVTGLELGNRISDSITFNVDHGFLYYIRSKSGIVFFEGKQTYFN